MYTNGCFDLLSQDMSSTSPIVPATEPQQIAIPTQIDQQQEVPSILNTATESLDPHPDSDICNDDDDVIQGMSHMDSDSFFKVSDPQLTDNDNNYNHNNQINHNSDHNDNHNHTNYFDQNDSHNHNNRAFQQGLDHGPARIEMRMRRRTADRIARD